ncbi:glycosyltransferase family 2 protein [Nostoc sp.]|uniref:glycosyltransferase family 2 protein n=1 Tax=Nostoc sp. TaxID=1180 RepID=UPI002FF6339F
MYHKSAPDVSIVIPTRNGGELFRDVLAKLRQQEYQGNFEILVVDSSSSDKTVEFAKEFGAKVVVIPAQEFNHGLTRNYGISLATAEIVILMTQDALPANNKLIHHLVANFTDEAVGGAYARQLARPEADILTKRNLENWLTGRAEPEVRQMTNPDIYEKLPPLEKYLFCNFDNVCSAIRKTAWEKVAFTKNDFGEDIDWCLRTLKMGWKITYQSQAIVIHSHDRSVIYEYKRTYMCHRKLYELFELECVPSLKFGYPSLIQLIISEFLYVVKHEPNLQKKLKLLFRIPALTVASFLGQYRGAQDEKLKRGKKMSGV